MQIKTKKAKKISYGGQVDPKDIKYIVIHYTGVKGDNAANNAKFFSSGNTRQAGAHYFVDQSGEVWNSVPFGYAAWAVGGFYSKSNGAGKYYQKCTNYNSISIELCDCMIESSWEQMKATKELVEYIKKKCPNANTIIRHWDVNGKTCPAPMVGTNNKLWKHFHSYLTNGYQYKGKVTEKAALRSSKGVKPTNKIGSKTKGDIVYITKISGNWGRLKNKTADGKYRWISLKKVSEI